MKEAELKEILQKLAKKLVTRLGYEPITEEITTFLEKASEAALVSALANELHAVYRLLEDRRKDLARCPRHPNGERCTLPVGHEGGCKWERGD